MNELEREIHRMEVELFRLDNSIEEVKDQIKFNKFAHWPRMMSYYTTRQFEYMNWYREVLWKRLELMRKQKEHLIS